MTDIIRLSIEHKLLRNIQLSKTRSYKKDKPASFLFFSLSQNQLIVDCKNPVEKPVSAAHLFSHLFYEVCPCIL